MSCIPNSSLLHSLTHHHGHDAPQVPDNGKQNQKLPRSSSPLSSLIHFARNPIDSIGQAVENWYDGSTKEERATRQSLADRKQLLYLKLRIVRVAPRIGRFRAYLCKH